jgi:Zn-dependent protease
MNSSWKVGKAFGIPLYIHWTFLLLFVFVLWPGQGIETGAQALYTVAMILAVFGCVVLHELGHALTARHFDIGTRDITLYPIGGVARLERMSEKPWEEFWIAVAGPAVNVVIAVVLAVVSMGLMLVSQTVPELRGLFLAGQFLFQLMILNGILVVFNLLPAFPMDGGRVLRALLASGMDYVRATRIAVNVGVVMAVLMVAAAIGFRQPLLGVVALFVFLAGQQELLGVQRRQRMRWEEEPVEVLPVNPRPEPELPPSDLPPAVVVYTWDEKAGVWVKQPPPRPVHFRWNQ